jgi:hypothetical protein
MASISAYVVIGQSHPNEIGLVNTKYILELWEGDKATWNIRDVARNDETSVNCVSPSEITQVLLRFISESQQNSLAHSNFQPRPSILIVPLTNSSLEVDIKLLVSHLSELSIDYHIFTTVNSHVVNAWTSMNTTEE